MGEKRSPENEFAASIKNMLLHNTWPKTEEEWAKVVSGIKESNQIRGRNVLRDLSDYDLFGYLMNNQVDARHGTDTYKKPSHPSFSNESKYSKPGREGGEWSGTDQRPVFTPSEWMVGEGRLNDTMNYYDWLNALPGETPVEIRDPRVSPPFKNKSIQDYLLGPVNNWKKK